MIIDFLGISGVGKTTIAKQKKEELVQNKNEVIWPWYNIYVEHNWLTRNIKKLYAVTCFSICNFRWVIKLIKILNIFADINLKEKIRVIFNGIYLKKNIIKCKNKEAIYLFDEGVCHYIWALYLRSNMPIDEKIITEIINHFYLPNTIVVVDAKNRTIKDRLVNRNVKTKILKSNDLLESIKTNKDNLNIIIEIIKKNYPQINFQYIWNDKGSSE